MLKLAALGALGYAGYKYYQKNTRASHGTGRNNSRPAVTGGPLSDQAAVHPGADIPPPA